MGNSKNTNQLTEEQLEQLKASSKTLLKGWWVPYNGSSMVPRGFKKMAILEPK